ncbi:MAG: hypothetical protein WCA26_16805, partial [Xanthobacteraceae bacterium]
MLEAYFLYSSENVRHFFLVSLKNKVWFSEGFVNNVGTNDDAARQSENEGFVAISEKSLTIVSISVTFRANQNLARKDAAGRRRSAAGASAVSKPRRAGRPGEEAAVERREAQRARSRRFAQADCPV